MKSRRYFTVDDEKVLGWLRKGAQPTEPGPPSARERGIWDQYETDRKQRVARRAHRRRPGEGCCAPRRPTRDAAAKAAAACRRRGRRPQLPRSDATAGQEAAAMHEAGATSAEDDHDATTAAE